METGSGPEGFRGIQVHTWSDLEHTLGRPILPFPTKAGPGSTGGFGSHAVMCVPGTWRSSDQLWLLLYLNR